VIKSDSAEMDAYHHKVNRARITCSNQIRWNPAITATFGKGLHIPSLAQDVHVDPGVPEHLPVWADCYRANRVVRPAADV